MTGCENFQKKLLILMEFQCKNIWLFVIAAKCRKSLEDDPPLRVVLYRIQTEPKPDKNGKKQESKTRNKSVSFVESSSKKK